MGVIHRNLSHRGTGRACPPGEEIRKRHGGQSRHHRARRHAGRCAGADGAPSHLRRAGGGRRQRNGAGKLVGILTNRDVRFAADPRQKVRRADDQGQAGHGARRRADRTKPSGFCTSTASRRSWWWTTPIAASDLITVKDIEKAQKYPNACKDERGRLRVAAATGVGEDGYAARDGADRGRMRRDRGRHRPWPFAGRARHGGPHQARKQLHPGGGRQYRHRRRRQGADRCGRRRGEGRHRAGLDLHHPHRGGRGRAATDRRSWMRCRRRATRACR